MKECTFSYNFVMPTWSEDEALNAYRLFNPAPDNETEEEREQRVKDLQNTIGQRYRRFGGQIPLLLWTSEEKLVEEWKNRVYAISQIHEMEILEEIVSSAAGATGNRFHTVSLLR